MDVLGADELVSNKSLGDSSRKELPVSIVYFLIFCQFN